MDRFFQSLRPFIRGVVRHAVWVVLVAVLFSGVGLYYALNLRIDTDFAKLLPDDYPSVQALERLRQTVGGESDVQVLIKSPSFEANRRFAQDLIPRALALTADDRATNRAEPYFTHAEFRRDADFLRDNALYFASSQELDQLETYLSDQIEQAKLEANPFYFDLEEDDASAEPDTAAQNLQQVYQDLTVDEYTMSPDSTEMQVSFYPSGSKTNIGFIEALDADLQALIAELDPTSYHPQMQTSVAGRTIRQMIEFRAITGDVFSSFGVGVAAVLLFVVLYFFYKGLQARSGGRLSRRVLLAELARTPVMALLIGLPLLMSLAWTGGVAYLAFETLNLMTSTLGLVLFGLGIDFGIHFFARYSEERGDGRSVADAAEYTFTSTGQAITVGALTTAAGLYVLTAADFKGFSEFGFIAGTGVLFALVAMTVVMPALLALAERTRLLNLQGMRAPAPETASRRRFPAARGIVAASLVAVVAGAALLPLVNFQYDFGVLEPDYEAWSARNRIGENIEEHGGGGRNPAYIVTDNPDEVPAVVEAVRTAAAHDTLSPTIDHVESLQDRFPLKPAGQQAKLQRIAEIRETLSGRYLSADSSEDLQNLRRAAQTRQPIAIEAVPDYLKDRFISKSGEVGGIVMIYPSVGLSDGRQSIAFADDAGEIEAAGQTYYASSTSIVAADMLELMLDEAPWMVGATFLIVALLMGVNFRSLRWAALALVPLVVGVLWMLLLMEVFGLSLNFYNMIVLPAVLGIGNDAGVHLVHRYREEGAGSILQVLRSTGEHVAMGSLTTMIGFGGLLLSFHPGLRSIGTLAVAGIGATLLAALVFLPALLQWLEDRRQSPTAPAATNGHAKSAPVRRAPEPATSTE